LILGIIQSFIGQSESLSGSFSLSFSFSGIGSSFISLSLS